MDPNATYQAILDGLDVDDTETVSDNCDNLNRWIDRGGFLPAELESIAETIRETAAKYVDRGETMDFRIYIRPSGNLSLCTGDASYDQDHRGFCGADSIAAGDSLDDCRKATVRAFNDAIEFYFFQ